MKNHRKALALAAVLVLTFSALTGAAYAAEPDSESESAPLVPVYPAEVRTSEENGVIRVEKVYYLTAHDDLAAIPTDDFDREGRHYTLLDVLKNDLTETETKDYVEVITLESSTKDVGEIIKVLEPELEVITEDGFTGVLKPDYTTISTEPAGYKTSSWTVTATRTYPNLSDADLSLLPKSIEDSGRTLTLADVNWQEAAAEQVDGVGVAVRYTAVASYTGTATSRNVTGYTVTVDYTGEITKTSNDTVIYTAVFSAENTSHDETDFEDAAPAETAGTRSAPEDEPTTEPAEQAETENTSTHAPLIVGGILLLCLAGYGAWRGVKYCKDKKRGYVK